MRWPSRWSKVVSPRARWCGSSGAGRSSRSIRNRSTRVRRPSGHREHQHDTHGMRLAMEEAQAAGVAGDVPVGAVLMRIGEIVARGRNRMKGLSDPRHHAEIDCLDAALDKGHRGVGAFEECTLYVTVEPC